MGWRSPNNEKKAEIEIPPTPSTLGILRSRVAQSYVFRLGSLGLMFSVIFSHFFHRFSDIQFFKRKKQKQDI